MKVKSCAICDSPIDQSNNSEEHLILNAIGGRRKLRGIVCVACNGGAGSRWDSVLADQLSAFSLLCRVKRQRGKTPSRTFVTTAGEQLRMDQDGTLNLARPTIERTSLGDGRQQVKMIVRSMEEGREKLEELKRKFPSIDVDRMLNEGQERTTHPRGAMTFSAQIGGAEAGRSLVKSTLCLAVANGVSPAACNLARDYLKRLDAEPCFGYYFERDLVLNRPAQVPLHCVAVSNKGCDGQLLGYVEYFGVHRAVVCLTDRYDGPDIHVSYAVDPVAGKDFLLEFELRLSRADVAATYAYERIPEGAMEAAMNQVLPKVFRDHFERAKERALTEAITYALKECGAIEGEILTAEQLHKFSGLFAQRITPFLLQTLRKPDVLPLPGVPES